MTLRFCIILAVGCLASATAFADTGPAPNSPPSPSGRGYLILGRKEVAACLKVQGKILKYGSLRYCSKPFVEDRADELKD